MRRLLMMTLTVFVLLALAACSGNAGAADTATQGTQEPPTTQNNNLAVDNAPAETTPTSENNNQTDNTDDNEPAVGLAPISTQDAWVESSFVSVAASLNTSFVVRPNGSLLSWGGTRYGELGNGIADRDQITSTPVEILDDVVSIHGGWYQAMAIRSDGSLWGWGRNSAGVFGDGTREDRPYPAPIMGDVATVSISSSSVGHVLAVRTDGSLWAWGRNFHGQIGIGTNSSNDENEPQFILDNVIAVSAGNEHSMAIRIDNTLWGWGHRDPLGIEVESLTMPYPAKIMDDVIAVSAGGMHTLAIRSDNSLWAWGRNGTGQIGNGTTTNQYYPIRIMENVIAIATGGDHSVALTADGAVWTWGSNRAGVLGDGTNTRQLSPMRVMENAVAIETGPSHMLVITDDGSLWGFGSNAHGRLGIGEARALNATLYTPTKIMDEVRLPASR